MTEKAAPDNEPYLINDSRPLFHPERKAASSDLLERRRFHGYTCSMAKSSNGHVLQRILDPVSSSLNDEAARKLIGLKADRKAQARVAALARKCNEGALSPEERAEYEYYVMAGEFIAILQAKARLLLARRGQAV